MWKKQHGAFKRRQLTDECFDDDFVEGDLMNDYISRDAFLATFENRPDDGACDGSQFGDAELVLLPRCMPAYILHRRQWALVPVDGLRPVAAQNEGWDDLRLPEMHKKMVLAQIQSHLREKKARGAAAGSSSRKADVDIVHGKGEGLIILLHGVPGVGKTSTAECVAESLGQPLFPITCGDLGTTAAEVEKSLNDIFDLAANWNCVLLLDEADVFLAQRTRGDIERNAVVSGRCFPLVSFQPRRMTAFRQVGPNRGEMPWI
jgi:hypothetical protein